jgi:hypothetical protein
MHTNVCRAWHNGCCHVLTLCNQGVDIVCKSAQHSFFAFQFVVVVEKQSCRVLETKTLVPISMSSIHL